MNNTKLITLLSVPALAAVLLSCGSKGGAAAAQSAMPAPNVSVLTVTPQDIPIYSEYAAQTFARDSVDVRGRVDGYIEKRQFQVGSDVKAGQVLYVLDQRPYQAEVAKAKGDVAQSEANLEFAQKQVALIQAQADLTQASANLAKAKQDVTRLEPLVKQEAAAQQDLDNAVSAEAANQANVDARKAAVQQTRLSTKSQIATSAAQLDSNRALLRNAELNLEYATIRAPVAGRIGDTLIPVGGLVSKTASQPLTNIVPLDPIWVRFKVSEAEYLNYLKRKDRPQLNSTPLELVLANNTTHPYAGHIQNTINQVDPKTGTLELQATFPNPQHNILPGQFGRIRLRQSEQKAALAVPQRAMQELQGQPLLLTVDANNKVVPRPVVTGDRVGDLWIVQQGLAPGDRVIVEGVLKARPGSVVNPQPFKPAPPAPAPAG